MQVGESKNIKKGITVDPKDKKIVDNKGFIDVKKESESKKVPGSKTTETVEKKTTGKKPIFKKKY